MPSPDGGAFLEGTQAPPPHPDQLVALDSGAPSQPGNGSSDAPPIEGASDGHAETKFSAPETEGHEKSPKRKKQPSRWLIPFLVVTGGTFALLAVLLAGAALGQVLWPAPQPPTPVVLPSVSIEPEEQSEKLVMPGLFGLDEAAVKLVLQDSGLAEAKVVVRKTPAPGEAGLVLEQIPAAGESVEPTVQVEIVYSESLPMTDLVGKDATVAIAELEQMGVWVNVKKTITADQDPGKVISSKPAAGTAMPLEVELEVSDPGQSVFVVDTNTKRSVADSCSLSGYGSERAGGKPMEKYVSCRLYDRPLRLALTPGRNAILFSAEAALADDSAVDAAHVVISGDQKVLKEFDVPRGQIVPITLRIPDVFDLTVEVTGDKGTELVLGSVRYAVDPAKLGNLQ